MPNLRTLLTTLLTSGTDDNPALNTLLAAHARFHLVLAVVGGAFLVAVGVFSGFCWQRFRRSRPRTFERRTFLSFGLLGAAVSLFLAVLIAANVSNVVDPRPGFSSGVDLIRSPRAGTGSAELQDSFAAWLRSGRSEIPARVQSAIDDRLAWQRPKAIVCAVLLVLVVWLGVVVWRRLLRRSGGSPALLLSGIASVPVGLVLMGMVMGNTEASFAPITLTLLYS